MARQRVRWHSFEDDADLCADAVTRIEAACAQAIAERGRFDIVLAGGNTPRPIYRALRDADADWSRWHIWYGDERCVAVGDPERNSAMARAEWLDHVALPAANIHTIPAELGADAGARAYAQTLVDVGTFDVVLLGLGEDGHTASLFPGNDWGEGVDAPDTLAVSNSPKPPPQRVSLSAARLSDARAVLFLVDGPSKVEPLARWRAGERIPAASITPTAGVDILLAG